MRQAFGQGDIARLKSKNFNAEFKVKILECIQDEDGGWWYDVTPVDFTPISMKVREVPQKALERWEA